MPVLGRAYCEVKKQQLRIQQEAYVPLSVHTNTRKLAVKDHNESCLPRVNAAQ